MSPRYPGHAQSVATKSMATASEMGQIQKVLTTGGCPLGRFFLEGRVRQCTCIAAIPGAIFLHYFKVLRGGDGIGPHLVSPLPEDAASSLGQICYHSSTCFEHLKSCYDCFLFRAPVHEGLCLQKYIPFLKFSWGAVRLGREQNYMGMLSRLCLSRNLVIFSQWEKSKHRGGEEKLRIKILTSNLEESIPVYIDLKLN